MAKMMRGNNEIMMGKDNAGSEDQILGVYKLVNENEASLHDDCQ